MLEVKWCGKVNYYKEMPYVFALSDINLNISVKRDPVGNATESIGCYGERRFSAFQLSAGIG